MIYILAFCPSLEYSGIAENVVLGENNKITHGVLRAGGDGALTAQVLAQLEVPVTMLGFAAGYSGGEIESILRRHRIDTDFVYLENSLSPINFTVNHGSETRFATLNPDISFNDLTILLNKLPKLKDGDMLLLSGNVPESMPSDICENIPDLFGERDVRIALDIASEHAVKCLHFSPFLMVTSPERITEAFGEPPQSEEEIFACIAQFQEMGAQNVLVCLDGGGALLLDSSGGRHCCVDRESVISGKCCSVAKSAMTAGFLAGADDKDVDSDYALMLAAAASRAASAINDIPTKPKVIDIMKELLKNYKVQ